MLLISLHLNVTAALTVKLRLFYKVNEILDDLNEHSLCEDLRMNMGCWMKSEKRLISELKKKAAIKLKNFKYCVGTIILESCEGSILTRKRDLLSGKLNPGQRN